MTQRCWCEVTGLKQTKAFIKGRMPKFTSDLVQQGGTAKSVLVGLFTGPCKLNRHIIT